jgi:asparagine synthase (glutamine-hydrolysing)
LKTLHAHPEFNGEIDRDSLTLFLRTGYIPAPYSIYRGIYKLAPGSLLELKEEASSANATVYWQAKTAADQGMLEPFTGNDTEAINELDSLLQDAIRLQVVADVPVGAFLSGGIDSTAVVAIMQAQARAPIKTFSIGFNEPSYDEARHAKDVARYLHTDHTEMYVTPREAREVIPHLPYVYDEPFADSSQIPTFLVSKLTRGRVTVSLSGDGGDELFAGYSHYALFQRQWAVLQRIPELLRGLAVMAAAPLLRRRIGVANEIGSGKASFWMRRSTAYLRRVAEILSASRPELLYGYLISQWKNPSEVVIGGSEPRTAFSQSERHVNNGGPLERVMYLDQITYLPDDILAKVDRASMAVGLEARVPLLDHRVVEFSWRLPLSLKSRNGQGKWLLRQVLGRYVPPEMTERPKQGFSVPIGAWLCGPLRPWAEHLLDERRLADDGFFNPRPIRNAWQEHLSGRRTLTEQLWTILMFQSWKERWRG